MKKIFVFAFSIIVLVICSGFTISEELLLDGTAFQSAEYIRNNFSIYDLSFEGESVAKDGILDNFEYSVHDGYNYEGKEMLTFDIENEQFYNPLNYDGTDTNGKIIDISKYVADRYYDYNGGANGNTWLGSFIVEA